jgi:hypothetical protein
MNKWLDLKTLSQLLLVLNILMVSGAWALAFMVAILTNIGILWLKVDWAALFSFLVIGGIGLIPTGCFWEAMNED